MNGSGARSRLSWNGLGLHFRSLLTLLLSLGLALGQVPPTTLAQSDPCPEPNNGFNTACFVGSAVPSVRGFISSADDVDTYKFEVNVPLARVRVELGDLPADYDLHLFDGNAALLTESLNQGAGADTVELTLIRGSYFAFANSAQGGFNPGQPYTLTISVSPLADPRPGLSGDPCPEPNDTLDNACAVTSGLLAMGGLATSDDVDLYRVQVDEDESRVTAQLGDTADDLRFDILDAGGEEAGSAATGTIWFARQSTGTYYVRVHRTADDPDPTPYELLVTINSPTLAPPASSKDPCPEPNDDGQRSCPLGGGGTARGFISNPADIDFYSFEVTGQPAWVHAELVDQPADYGLDLQNERGDSLATSHNTGTFPEAVDVDLEPGRYIVAVYSLLAQGSDDNPYTLNVSQAPLASGSRPPSTFYLADDFSSPGAHFSLESNDPGRWGLGNFDGEYVVTLRHPGGESIEEWDSWAGLDIDNFQLDLDARVTGLPDQNGGVAVSWRYQDATNAYALYIDVVNGGSEVGAAKLTRWQDGDPVDIADWIESPAIHRGVQTNHITLRAQDDTFSVVINGQPLLSARDTTFARGDIAIGAITWDRPTEVRYDNLLVSAPQ